MVTIIEDSLGDYGVDEVGGRCHDLLGTRCDPYGELFGSNGVCGQIFLEAAVAPSWIRMLMKWLRKVNRMLTGKDFDYHCHSNLTRAVLPYGLAESDIHDVLNVFQVTGLNSDGQYFMYVSQKTLLVNRHSNAYTTQS